MNILRLGGAALALMLAALPAAKSATAFPCPAPLRVGVSELGYSSYQENGQIKGASVEMLAELRQRSGCAFELRFFPRERLFIEFQKGNIDMTMASVRTPDRERAGNFIPYTYTIFDLLLSASVKGDFFSLTDFVDHSSASLNLTRGAAFTPEVTRQIARLEQAGRVAYVTDYTVAFNKLLVGRAEGVISSPVIYQQHMKRIGTPKGMRVIPLPEAQRQPVGLYLSKTTVSNDVHDGIASIMQEIVTENIPARIYSRYIDAATMARVFPDSARSVPLPSGPHQ